MNWLEGILERSTGKIWRTTAESWEWVIFRNDGLWRYEMETTHEMLWMGEKNSHNRKQLWEDGIKLGLRIFVRTGKDLRGTLLWSSKDDEKHHQNYWDTPGEWKRGRVEPKMKRIWKRTWRWHVTDGIHSYVTLWKELRITPGELEESGKILGKDLWVRAHWREKHRWKGMLNR